MFDDALHQEEEALSEFRVGHQVLLDHFECAVTKAEDYVLEEVVHLVAQLLEHGCKQSQHFCISRLGCSLLIVIYKALKCGQKFSVEHVVVVLVCDVNLDKFEDVSAECFHELRVPSCLLVVGRLTNVLRVQLIHQNQVLEHLAQVN